MPPAPPSVRPASGFVHLTPPFVRARPPFVNPAPQPMHPTPPALRPNPQAMPSAPPSRQPNPRSHQNPVTHAYRHTPNFKHLYHFSKKGERFQFQALRYVTPMRRVILIYTSRLHKSSIQKTNKFYTDVIPVPIAKMRITGEGSHSTPTHHIYFLVT